MQYCVDIAITILWRYVMPGDENLKSYSIQFTLYPMFTCQRHSYPRIKMIPPMANIVGIIFDSFARIEI